MTYVNPLKMYHNDIDFIIAESEEEATKFYCEFHTVTLRDYLEECGEDRLEDCYWNVYPEDKDFTFFDECLMTEPETRQAQDWIEIMGKGWFASTEY